MKIYCDTNVFLDFMDDRYDKLRPLGDFAFMLFKRGWECLFHLVFSDWNYEELRKFKSEEEINELLSYFENKKKLIRVSYTEKEKRDAMNKSSHWQDELHMIIALREDCDSFVTRNVNDFSFSSRIDIRCPENI